MNYLIGATPFISNQIVSQVCPTKRDDGIDIPARPPSQIFALVWTVLFVLIGVSWVRTRKSAQKKMPVDLTFGALTASFLSWQYFNSCKGDKKLALYNIVISWTLSLIAAFSAERYSPGGASLVLPTTGWLFLATMLNYTQVNKQFEK